jgi:hypothetical protein
LESNKYGQKTGLGARDSFLCGGTNTDFGSCSINWGCVLNQIDVIIEDNLTVFMLHPVTDRAREWLFNLPDAVRWGGDCLAVDAERVPDVMIQLAARQMRWYLPPEH